MIVAARGRLARNTALLIMAGSALAMAGCGSADKVGRSRGKEYFAESEYGVKASPRVTNLRTNLPRGGGRDIVGKPYKVRGKWYRPQEDRNYRKVGGASWYGDAFHGRLTANGEIYDMTHLTAAHPTMPLPSYARVTNLKNGSSVIVRVNDRGPYADGRIIDLSKRAAQLLGYDTAGVAKVQVDYVGRAPLHGRDESYLMASYRPGKGARPIDDGLPSGVMIAMNGASPSAAPRPAPFPMRIDGPKAPEPTPAVTLATATLPMPASAPAYQQVPVVSPGDPILPEFGPWVPERPAQGFGAPAPMRVAALGRLSYADERIATAARAFASLTGSSMSADDVVAAWKRRNGSDMAAPARPAQGEYVAAATYADRTEAEALAAKLSDLGKVSIVADADSFSVVVAPDGRNDADQIAELAWQNGAPDAFVVRD